MRLKLLKKKGKQHRSRQTINTILAAATQVLIEHGYETATTNRIADRSGFSIGTLYQYFENKEDVYRELVDIELGLIVEGVKACEGQASLLDTLWTLIKRSNAKLKDNPGEAQALVPLLNGPLRSYLISAREAVIDSVAVLLAEHREEIVVENLELAARVLVNLTEGLATTLDPRLLPPDEFERQLVRLQYGYLTIPELREF